MNVKIDGNMNVKIDRKMNVKIDRKVNRKMNVKIDRKISPTVNQEKNYKYEFRCVQEYSIKTGSSCQCLSISKNGGKSSRYQKWRKIFQVPKMAENLPSTKKCGKSSRYQR